MAPPGSYAYGQMDEYFQQRQTPLGPPLIIYTYRIAGYFRGGNFSRINRNS